MSQKEQNPIAAIPMRTILPPHLQPKTDVEKYIFDTTQRLFETSPFIFSFYQFYIDTLGLDPYGSALFNSLDNPIYLSHNSSDMSKNHREVYSKVNRIFKEKSVDPAKSQKFSELYCALVTRLRDEAYVGNMQHDQKEQLLNELLEKANELQEKIDDNLTPPINRMIYSRQQQQVMRELDKLLESYIFNTLENAKQNCAMIQCSRNNSCEDYDKEKLDFFTMEIKEHGSGKIHRAPKINFEIDIEKLYSPDTCASYSETIDKVKKGEIDPEELVNTSNYFQSYKATQIFDAESQIEGKVMIAFERVIKVPVEFGAWFDHKVYEINVKKTQEISLKEGSYRTYAEYCRVPEKIVIGVRPAIIYSRSLGTFPIPNGFRKDDNSSKEAFQYYAVSKDEQSSVVVLGYELDDSLCNTPLVGEFKKHNVDDDHIPQDVS